MFLTKALVVPCNCLDTFASFGLSVIILPSTSLIVIISAFSSLSSPLGPFTVTVLF